MGRLLINLVLTTTLGCSREVAEFTVQTPAAAFASPVVSVVGVYHNGRLDAGYWDVVEEYVAPTLGKEGCEPGFSHALQEVEPLRFAEIDRSAKENGVSTDLMRAFAPYASSPDLMMFYASGKTPRAREEKKKAGFAEGVTFGSGGGGRGARPGGRGGRGGAGLPHPEAPSTSGEEDVGAFELEARLFSGESKTFVARVAMRYTGSSLDEAFSRFSQKLKETLPGVTCVGWSGSPKTAPSP